VPATFPIRITVCGFVELAGQCDVGVSHVLSLLDPDATVPSEFEVFPEHERLELRFHDIIEQKPALHPPGPEHVDQLLGLGRDVQKTSAHNLHLLIHCHAGFSRSPAALAVILAQAHPSLPAETIAAEVLRIRPNAWPNLRIIELGDRMLHRRGGLVDAAARIYRYRLAREPGLADMIIANGRVREVEAARG
jgi:predicted protein tyrosine phosphatase